MITSRFTPRSFTASGEAPANTAQPSLAPAPTVGNESEVDEGTWTGSPTITFTYQWQLDGIDIIGATAKTILVIAGMVGQALRCVVRATNSFGFSIAFTAAVIVTV